MMGRDTDVTKLIPAINAIDPFFVVGRVLGKAIECQRIGPWPRVDFKCPSVIEAVLRLPGAAWSTAK